MPRALLPACRVESDFFSFLCTFIHLGLHTSTFRCGGHIDACLSLPFLPVQRDEVSPLSHSGSSRGQVWDRTVTYCSLYPGMVLDVSYVTFGAGVIILILEPQERK